MKKCMKISWGLFFFFSHFLKWLQLVLDQPFPFWKFSWKKKSEKGALNLLLAPGARNPRYATAHAYYQVEIGQVCYVLCKGTVCVDCFINIQNSQTEVGCAISLYWTLLQFCTHLVDCSTPKTTFKDYVLYKLLWNAKISLLVFFTMSKKIFEEILYFISSNTV